MTIYATLSNGNLEQVILEGNTNKILTFIENYKGDDLGNELIMQDFVTNATPTGVVIYP